MFAHGVPPPPPPPPHPPKATFSQYPANRLNHMLQTYHRTQVTSHKLYQCLWKSFIRMVVMMVRKFLYHIQKGIYRWQFRCLEFRHLPQTLISRLKLATNFLIARSCRFGDHWSPKWQLLAIRKFVAYFSLLISVRRRCLNSRHRNCHR